MTDDRHGWGRDPEGPPTPDETPEETVNDGVLIRYLDGEIEGNARALLESHVARAPAAAARLEVLSRRSSGLSALLGELDPTPAGAERSEAAIRPYLSARGRAGSGNRGGGWLHRRTTMRAAAAITLFLGLTLAVPPARAWMVEQVRAVAEALGRLVPGAPSGAPAGAAPDAAAPGGVDAAFEFGVAGALFDVQVAEPAGSLIVRAGPGPSGRVEVAGAGGANLVLLPGGLRIDGRPAAGAVYELTLPPAVRTLRVRAGTAPPSSHPMPASGEALRIELARP